MKAAVISEIGNRFEMEDTHFLDLNFGQKGWVFGGIYDGHGGRFAAQYAAEYLHENFLEKLDSGLTPGESFIQVYHTISEELRNQDSGTTAVNFLIQGGEIFTANAGDARAIVVGAGEYTQLTVDHRLDNPEERKRIEQGGGRIQYPYTLKGGRGLMPTRTIGDEYFKSVGIISTPSVNGYTIFREDLILVAACDGLFDVMNNEEVADLARRFSEPDELVERLKREALDYRTGSDNLTIIAVTLNHPRLQDERF
ncbi:MAG: PP2C family protein-serine/threonine phosphatase [Pseudomonadota bacterium]